MYRQSLHPYRRPHPPALECTREASQWHKKPIRTQRRHRLPPMTKVARKQKYQKYARDFSNRRQDWRWSTGEESV